MVKKLKVGAIIQARLGSTRLPNKVLFSLPFNSGKTVIEHIVARAEASEIFNQILVATSQKASDNGLADFLVAKNIMVSRGDEDNVLQRYYNAAASNSLDIIVRLTGDNPCIDPHLIKEAVQFHIIQKNDYTKTTGLPIGINLEVFSFTPLQKAAKEAHRPEEKEHVTAYFINNPELFKIGILPYEFGMQAFSDFRVTIDYASDFALINLLFTKFINQPLFGIEELYDFWNQNQWVIEVNNNNFQKRTFKTLAEEKEEASKILTFLGMQHASDLIRNLSE
jgi:spore coat polysaccharide biosynthesis protein SpsF